MCFKLYSRPPKTAPSSPKAAQDRLQRAPQKCILFLDFEPHALQDHPRDTKDCPTPAKDIPKIAQDDSNATPTHLQQAPSTPQACPSSTQDRRRPAQDGPRRFKDCPKQAPGSNPKFVLNCMRPKTTQKTPDRPEMAPRSPKMIPRTPRNTFRNRQERPKPAQARPKTAQDRPKTALSPPKTGSRKHCKGATYLDGCALGFGKGVSVRRYAFAPRWRQDGNKKFPRCAKIAQDRPEITPRGSLKSPEVAQDRRKTHQRSFVPFALCLQLGN
jgi:hypothetical protein